MLIFLIFTFAQAFNADNTYLIHTIENDVSGKQNAYSDLYAIKQIFDSIGKEITLQDGRKVLCQIPIPQISNPLKMDSLQITRNLTIDEANNILFPLIGQCVYHSTKEFLYEYCYRKHVRQYDDLNTMLNMQKILKEDFSLGYSEESLNKNNSYANFEPSNTFYHVDTNYHQLLQQITNLIIIEGCLAKIRNFDQIISDKHEYQLNVSTTSQVYTFRVIQVIYKDLLLLSQCSDVIIISDYFEITSIKKNKIPIQQDQYYQYKNVIFGLNLQAQNMFHPEQTVAVIFTEKVFLVQIKKIIDFCAIQVVGFQSQIKYQKSLSQIKNLIVLDTDAYYEELNGPVLIRDNILFYDHIDKMNLNDYVAIYDNTTQVFSYIEAFRIIKNLSGIAILDKQFTQGLYYEGKAFIRRYGKFVQPQNFNKPLLDTYEYNNDYDLIPLFTIEYDQVQVHIFNDTKQGYKLQQQYQNYMGVSFSIYQLKSEIKGSLFLTLISEMYLTTTIAIITTTHQQNIFIKTQNGNYTEMESRFKNSSLLNQQYWIIIDNYMDKLYVGKENHIGLQNKLIEFQMQRKSNENSPITFEFDKKSNGLKIYDIMLIPLKNFKLFTTAFSTDYFHALNYTGSFDGFFEESYKSGSFCPLIHSSRKSHIKLSCHPGDLMRFISITEEEICKYQINIGTYLLCDKRYNIVEPTEHPILCILKE